MSKASSNTTLLAGIACVVAAGAAYYVMTQATPATSTKKSKKKKKKKEKKETETSAATSTTTTSSDTTTAPVPTASSPSAKTDATKATQNLSDVIDTQHNGVLHSELVDSSNSSVSATDVAMGVTTRDANGLQTGGVVGQDVILQFFEKSNTLLGEQNVKDDLAAAYSRGENISEILKQKQESVWASLKVEAQFGFTKIQKTLSDPNTMTVEIRDALVKAASMEDGILTYALLGSQEKFDAEQAKLKRLCVELKITKKVVFKGWVSNPQKYYLEAKILVFPSLYEGLPNTLIEAVNYNLPCISSRCSGAEDILTKKYGSFVSRKDEVELSNKMIDSIEDYEKILYKNKEIKKRIPRFLVNSQVIKYISYCNKILRDSDK